MLKSNSSSDNNFYNSGTQISSASSAIALHQDHSLKSSGLEIRIRHKHAEAKYSELTECAAAFTPG